ncbi:MULTISPECIES: SANT/Myb-like DNA-binding domain-containing protein [unclassified Paenibacillus]|uniref:SANT/Myb-like DNA-binding domain-containing protein n=1 Tax=unclassified Paenibacillus TaxID=185978 RepID=UPI0036358F02
MELKKKGWSTWEDEFIKKYYPSGDIQEILQHLPNRSIKTIKDRAYRLEVKRERGEKQSIGLISICKNEESSPVMMSFYRYLYLVKTKVNETGVKPDMDQLLRAFRDAYCNS